MENMNDLMIEVQALAAEVADLEAKYTDASRRLTVAKRQLLVALGVDSQRRPRKATTGGRPKRGGKTEAVLQSIRNGNNTVRSIADDTGLRYEYVQMILVTQRAKGTVLRPERGIYVLADPSSASGRVAP